MNFKGKDCVSHVSKRLAGMDERVNNSCKRRTQYLRCSLVIVHTQCSQWQVLAEVSVMEQVLREISKFPEILGKLSMRKQCVPGSFLPAHAREPGNEAKMSQTKAKHSERTFYNAT